MKNRVTEMLGTSYPIILGGMHWLGKGKLAAAVSEAGGFGLITAGSFKDKKELAAEIEMVRGLTEKPFGINISLGYRDMGEFFDAAFEANVRAVFTSGRSPEKYAAGIKSSGLVWVHVSPSLRFARKAEDMGADAVVLVGIEAGGHPGPDDVTLMALIPSAASVLKIPVIAAGAITNGQTFIAAMALGAEGVQIGTRFIATEECTAHDNVKQLIAFADETDTTLLSLKNGGRFRAIREEAVRRFIAAREEVPGNDRIELHTNSFLRAFQDGQLDQGSIIAGQGLGTINEVLTVKEVIDKIISEADQVKDRFASTF